MFDLYFGKSPVQQRVMNLLLLRLLSTKRRSRPRRTWYERLETDVAIVLYLAIGMFAYGSIRYDWHMAAGDYLARYFI
ncbi:hypothetical protein K2Q16_00485 [Patescibacteria group bacterium]|nr:hypothetical protein [Patescibacteria group bacterium]